MAADRFDDVLRRRLTPRPGLTLRPGPPLRAPRLPWCQVRLRPYLSGEDRERWRLGAGRNHDRPPLLFGSVSAVGAHGSARGGSGTDGPPAGTAGRRGARDPAPRAARRASPTVAESAPGGCFPADPTT